MSQKYLLNTSKLNAEADEFVPSFYLRQDKTREQETDVSWIKDETFLQRLKESRKFWKLKKTPSYDGSSCAACAFSDSGNNHLDENCRHYLILSFTARTGDVELCMELIHDMVILLSYHFGCEDKSKEYECKLCVKRYENGEEDDDSQYPCYPGCGCVQCEGDSDLMYSFCDEGGYEDEEEKEEDRREKVYQKRNQHKYLLHLTDKHKRNIGMFLRSEQDLIPMCDYALQSFDCDEGLDDVLHPLTLKEGIKFLHMENSSWLDSPCSPRVWQDMSDMETIVKSCDHY